MQAVKEAEIAIKVGNILSLKHTLKAKTVDMKPQDLTFMEGTHRKISHSIKTTIKIDSTWKAQVINKELLKLYNSS